MRKNTIRAAAALIICCLCFSACSPESAESSSGTENSVNNAENSGSSQRASYRSISQEEAMRIMKEEEGYVIVDVRSKDEYDTEHIPGAILIPNESIGTQAPPELPDKDQVILVYCRSGNRSRQASDKLAYMGYTNVLEFGGISSWTGEIEK